MTVLPPGTGGELGIKADISINSPEYLAYLDALKERERLREETGGDTSEGVDLVIKAAQGVDKLAQQNFQRERFN